MGCLFSHFQKIEPVPSESINAKTIPLRRIPKLLPFRSIIPSELNFEIQQTSDGQYFLNQSNKEIKYNYTLNKKRWSIIQLQSMNYPLINDDYRITIGLKEYDNICKYEYMLVPDMVSSQIDLESQFPSLSDIQPLEIDA